MSEQTDTMPPEDALELEPTEVNAPVVTGDTTLVVEPSPSVPPSPPRVPPYELSMKRRRPMTMQLAITLQPHTQAAAYGFPNLLFRPEKVEWEGPAQVIWLGQAHSSPLIPRVTDDRGDRGWRVFLVGDPVCFVVINSTNELMNVVLAVSGTSVV